MRFLVSNDDGVDAPGLLALFEALSAVGEVIVVAPTTEQSGSSCTLSVTKPLHAHTLASGFVAVNGSPADCIHLALYELYAHVKFDCVITGINSGANIGQDVMYSGTFGAAATACLFGIPAIATSLQGGFSHSAEQEQSVDYARAAAEIIKLVTQTTVLEALRGLPYHVLNVNIPQAQAGNIKGYRLTHLGHSQIARPVYHMIDPRGRDAYWLSLRKRPIELSEHQDRLPVSGTDEQALTAGYISLSPVRLHQSSKQAIDQLAALI